MASAVLLLPETKNQPDGKMWLEKQLQIATRHSKPVIGILPQETSLMKSLLAGIGMPSKFPEDLRNRVDEIAARNAADIIKTVDRLNLRSGSRK